MPLVPESALFASEHVCVPVWRFVRKIASGIIVRMTSIRPCMLLHTQIKHQPTLRMVLYESRNRASSFSDRSVLIFLLPSVALTRHLKGTWLQSAFVLGFSLAAQKGGGDDVSVQSAGRHQRTRALRSVPTSLEGDVDTP